MYIKSIFSGLETFGTNATIIIFVIVLYEETPKLYKDKF